MSGGLVDCCRDCRQRDSDLRRRPAQARGAGAAGAAPGVLPVGDAARAQLRARRGRAARPEGDVLQLPGRRHGARRRRRSRNSTPPRGDQVDAHRGRGPRARRRPGDAWPPARHRPGARVPAGARWRPARRRVRRGAGDVRVARASSPPARSAATRRPATTASTPGRCSQHLDPRIPQRAPPSPRARRFLLLSNGPDRQVGSTVPRPYWSRGILCTCARLGSITITP